MNFDTLEKRYGLPAGMLAAVQRVESGGNPRAVSPKGAQGLFQIMPATAKELGVDPLNPAQAADGAARYLAQNLKRFGTPELALAAYNAGPGNVQKHGGIPPFKETQNYVRKVQANMAKPESGPWEDYQGTESGPWEDYAAAPAASRGEAPKPARGASGSWGETRQDRAQRNRKDLAALGKGALSGLADIGDTVLNAATYLPGKVIPAVKQWNDERTASLEEFNNGNEANPNFKAGRITSNVVATLPVAGVVAKGASKVPLLKSLAPSIKGGGMAGGNLAQRIGGGAIAGTAAAGLVDPEHAATGGMIGGAIPGVAAAGKYVGNTARSLVQPLTSKGQDQIVNRVIEKFAKGGPTQVNADELIPGSMPTLSQATGNAGLARLENLLRDTNPNAFQEIAERNAAARANAFANVAGDQASISALKAARDQSALPSLTGAFTNKKEANPVYVARAIKRILDSPRGQQSAVVNSLTPIRSRLFIDVPVSERIATAYEPIDGLLKAGRRMSSADRDALLEVKRVLGSARRGHTSYDDAVNYLKSTTVSSKTANEAIKEARKSLVAETKFQTDPAQLYGVRDEIRNMLSSKMALANPGAQQASRELLAIRKILDRSIEKAAPGFQDYLAKYAAGSKPIDAQQFLQSVNIADANGIIQLGKVQAAIRNIEKLQKARGANQAKSIAPAQMEVLYKIRDDLLRANRQNLGRSAGSNTRQNFALENILDNALPGPLRALQNPMGRLGKVSKVIYGSADEEIRNRLVDLLLNPANSRLVNNGQLGLLGQGTPKPFMRGLLPNNALPVGGAGLLEEPY